MGDSCPQAEGAGAHDPEDRAREHQPGADHSQSGEVSKKSMDWSPISLIPADRPVHSMIIT